MKTLIISYSFTGNNSRLSQAVAAGLHADRVEIREKKKRNVLTIVLDVVLNRIPEIFEPEKQPEQYDHLIFIAPVWFGKIATPLRPVFRRIKNQDIRISLVAFSAGSQGVNSNLGKELAGRTGIIPETVLNPLITDLLPARPKPSTQTLDNYRLSDDVAQKLSREIMTSLM